MPRAAMSVAISARALPDLNSARARVRWPWLLSPWMAAHSTPAPWRNWATRSAPRLVRVNTRARAMASSANSSASRARLRGASMNSRRCSMRSTVEATGVTVTVTGLDSSSPASLPISSGMVAEKNRFWRLRLMVATMRRMGGRKPRSSIWSASSSTKISVVDRSAVFSPIWSIRRPGVATRMSRPPARALTCGPYLAPPKITPTEKPRWAP